MPGTMTLSAGIVAAVVAFVPVLFTLIVLFVIFSWLRILVDLISGKGF